MGHIFQQVLEETGGDLRTLYDVLLNGPGTRSGRRNKARERMAERLRAHGIIVPGQPQPMGISSLQATR